MATREKDRNLRRRQRRVRKLRKLKQQLKDAQTTTTERKLAEKIGRLQPSFDSQQFVKGD